MKQTTSRSSQGSVNYWVISAILVVLVAAIAAVATYLLQQRTIDSQQTRITSLTTQLAQRQVGDTTDSYTSTKGILVNVYTPARNSRVTSPLTVMGQVPGTWSFEASFPVELLDSAGRAVGSGSAHLLSDWMTDKLVPFTAAVTYAATPHGSGTLVLHKDNPSGLKANEDEVRIPVRY